MKLKGVFFVWNHKEYEPNFRMISQFKGYFLLQNKFKKKVKTANFFPYTCQHFNFQIFLFTIRFIFSENMLPI